MIKDLGIFDDLIVWSILSMLLLEGSYFCLCWKRAIGNSGHADQQERESEFPTGLELPCSQVVDLPRGAVATVAWLQHTQIQRMKFLKNHFHFSVPFSAIEFTCHNSSFAATESSLL